MDSYVGKRLDGRYEIREIIGVGGMAVVYKAYDNIDDRTVAIKILKEEFLANEEFRRRFKNESKAIAVLSHPNIVKVYDVSFGDRLQYIVMEYVEGITLKEYIEQQKVISWKEAVHFTTQILRALQHAHDKGIVHRDVKPQNILLLSNGNIKVTDFGIARFSRGETRTMTESAIGSVHYISPEQARGEITDDKADIYSVGVVLYEMITGRLPFESDSAVSVAIMQLQNEAAHPRDINPEIPIGLEQITLRAMQKNTKDRYQSAAEMLLDIDEFRRNPAIKFDYSYFVDREPTKFIPGAPSAGERLSSAALPHSLSSEEPDDEAEEPNKTVPVVVGIISAIVAAVLLIIIFLALFTDVFKNDKVKVPDLLGKNYAEDVQGNSKYDDFRFEVNYVTSTRYSTGEISKQSPYGGAKVRKGSVIKLDVVSGGALVKIPDVVGSDYGSAKRMLSSAGFSNFSVVERYEPEAEKGSVLKTDPEGGTRADTSKTIIIYVATDENENEVEVPNVIGLNYDTNKSEVESFFTSLELKVGQVKYEDSKKPKGEVLSMSIDPKQKVSKGTKIDLVLSSGKVPSSEVLITYYVPKSNTGDDVKVKFYISGTLVGEETISRSTEVHTKKLSGSGADQTVEIKAFCPDDKEDLGYPFNVPQKIYSAKVDFTVDPPKVTDEHNTRLLHFSWD